MKKLNLRFIVTITLISLFFLNQGCHNQTTKNELENLKTLKENQNHNKEIARMVFASIDKNDFVKLSEILSDDFALSSPGLTQSWKKDDLFNDIKSFYASFPDWTHNLNDIIAEGDQVVVKLTGKGTHKGEYQSIPPTGKIMTQSAIHILTFSNGKIKDWWAVEDNLGFMTQLGMELKPINKK